MRHVILTLVPRLATVIVAACGSSAPAPLPVAATAIATPRLGADDVEVARVDGRPVWASCVAAQAAGLAAGPRSLDEARAAALDQCIAFELLARAAEARGLAGAPEVVDATRSAAVNRLIETEFEQRYQRPADLAPAIDAILKKNEWRMHVPDLRASTFARFLVPAHAAPEVDAAAHALADQLAHELAGQTGLFGVHLIDAAKRIAAGGEIKLDTADVKPMARDSLVDSYAEALYALREVGESSPAFRTQWGWDVIVWTGGIAPRERTRDELVAEIFPEVRRRQFQLWVSQLGKQLGVHIEVEPAALEQLDNAEPADGAAPSGGSPAAASPARAATPRAP